MPTGNDMVALLLFLILLVIAWPVFAIFGGTLLLVFGSHLHIIVPTVLISIAYIAFLAPIAKRNNIKLGGKMGEASNPSKPIGPEFQKLMQENGDASPVKPSFFSTPDQWKPVSHDADHKSRHDQPSARSKPKSTKRTIVLTALAVIVAAPLTVLLLDTVALLNRGVQTMNAKPPSVLAVASPASASSGRWLVQSGQSATLDAISGTNYLGQPVTLTVWCDKWPDLKLDFHDYLGSDRGIDGYKT